MRQIKFRAWDSKNNQWVEEVPYLKYLLDDPDAAVSHHDIDDSDSLFFYPENPLVTDHGGRIIYSQFTGLLDKNGKEIYEGDYVRFPNFSPTHETSDFKLAEVFWYDDESGFFVGSQAKMIRPIEISSIVEDSEVIGNIYENPELLQ